MTTIALGQKSLQHKARAISLPALNFKLIYGFGLVALFALLIFYIYSINALTSGSYAIKASNKEIAKLEAENNRLEASVASSSFMGDVQEQARQLGFEKTTKVKYIEVVGNAVAVK